MCVDFRVRCAEKKINYGTGFEQAINTWLIASSGDDLLSQPPFDSDAMVIWICNYAYTDPYPSEDKGKVGKKKRKA